MRDGRPTRRKRIRVNSNRSIGSWNSRRELLFSEVDLEHRAEYRVRVVGAVGGSDCFVLAGVHHIGEFNPIAIGVLVGADSLNP